MAVACGAWGLAGAATVQVAVQDGQGRPVAGAVVFLDSAAARAAVQPGAVAQIVQQSRQFRPLVTVVPRGTQVQFPNRDTVRHHVYSFSEPKKFELKLYSGDAAAPVTFDSAGIVVLGCNIHDDMVAWVVVVDTPHFGTTPADGRAAFDKVPAGAYQLRVWHPGLPPGAAPLSQALAVADGTAPTATTVRLDGVRP